jgi:hypothetical protein
MQIHTKGKSNLDQNSKKKENNKVANEANGAGILKKFKDLDNIPDFSWGNVDESTFAFDENTNEIEEVNSYQYQQPHRSKYPPKNQCHRNDGSYKVDVEDDEIVDESLDGRDDWPSSRQPPANVQMAPFYQTKSAGGGISPRLQHSQHPAVAKSGFKTAPSKIRNVHPDSDEDEYNIPDVYDAPPKKAEYSPGKPVNNRANNIASNSTNAKAPPMLPFQQLQQQHQKPSIPITNNNRSQVKKATVIASPSVVPNTKLSPPDRSPIQISVNNSYSNNNSSSTSQPPFPCEQPLNQPKQQASPKSPTQISNQDKLFYTKQPRAVEFKPYTLQQYKLIKPIQYTEIQGKLRPDLNSDELIAKRKNAERIKEFSKQLRQLNADVLTQQAKLPSASEQNDLQIARSKYESSRQRALDFARNNVPKPKQPSYLNVEMADADNRNNRSRSAPPKNHNSQSMSRESSNDPNSNVGMLMDEDAFQAAKLQELEAKHQQSKMKMEAIKRSLNGF